MEHAFEFPLFMLYLDLDELPALFHRSWLWSADRPAFARFRRSDHLGDPNCSLAASVRELVEERVGCRPLGPIRLLTHLRYAGFAINPVSFYYCFDSQGRRVESIVAEVTNTPWGERHCYVLPADAQRGSDAIRARTSKEFHVSPFMQMDVEHVWSFREPGRHLGVRIANYEPDGSLLFDAALGMRRRELSARSRASMVTRYPFITLRVFAAIYWQALRLHLAGAPFHPHPRTLRDTLEATS